MISDTFTVFLASDSLLVFPVSLWWKYSNKKTLLLEEEVLMHRCVQGGTLYMHDEFGVDGTVSVGVIRTSCFMAKHRNCPHSHAQQE